jgi:hypothetical protein
MGTLREQSKGQVLRAYPGGRRNLRQKAGEWTAYATAVFKILQIASGDAL